MYVQKPKTNLAVKSTSAKQQQTTRARATATAATTKSK